MKISELTSSGRQTIPADIHKKYEIKPGTRIQFIDESNGIKILPVTKKTIHDNLGFLNIRGSLHKSLMEEKIFERDL